MSKWNEFEVKYKRKYAIYIKKNEQMEANCGEIR